ncbi:hypothetical protein, partial [Serratia sp. CY43514]|uniref:hypothetical protein n=1 Tax=Serratia sp. CY43514 TaxID=3383620 RepID=UPI0040289E63
GDDQHAQRNGDRFGGGFRQAKHSDFSSSQGYWMRLCACKLKFLFTIKTRKPTVFIIKSSEGALPHSEHNG